MVHMESSAAIHGRMRLMLQAYLLPTERVADVPAAGAVDVAAGVTERTVIDPRSVAAAVGVTDCLKIEFVVFTV